MIAPDDREPSRVDDDAIRSRSLPATDRGHEAEFRRAPDTTADADELLSLLGDEYAREILTTLEDQSLPAREIDQLAQYLSTSQPVFRSDCDS
jgi:hypothetical protein